MTGAPTAGPPAPQPGRGSEREPGRAARWLSWAPVAALSIAIFLVSGSERPVRLTPRVPHLDKVLHFGAYGLWGALFALPLALWLPRLRGAAFVAAVAVAGALYGLSDELHQGYVPGRSPDAADWAADTLGALAGGAGAWALRVMRQRRRASGGGIE